MRLYIDTEFNGFGGELISMALVCEDGRHWYEVLDLPGIEIAPWVAENVMPHLGKPPISFDVFRASFLAFLAQFERPTIVADWPSDFIYFYYLLMGDDHTQTVMYPCATELVSLDIESEIGHNALSDARAIQVAYLAQREAA